MKILEDTAETAFSTALMQRSERIEDVPIAMVIASSDHCFYANNKMNELLGYQGEEICQLSLTDWVCPESLSLIYERFSQRLSGKDAKNNYESTLIKKSGEQCSVIVFSEIIQLADKPVGLIWAIDITERRKAERALKANEEQLRFALEGSGDGIWDWHVATNVTQYSERSYQLLGRAAFHDDLNPKNWMKALVHSEDRQGYIDALTRLVKTGCQINEEFRMLHTSGEYRWFNSRAMPVYGDDGRVVRVSGIFRDITIAKNNEIELKQHRDNLQVLVDQKTAEQRQALTVAESANKAKSEFLANMSHELRTPMHAILGFAGFGLKRLETAPLEKLGYYFDRINSSGLRLLNLLNNLLDLSKLESGKVDLSLRSSDIRPVVLTMLNELESIISKKNLVINVEAPDFSTTTLIDSIKIAQVINNLLSNAIKFTPEGSNIQVSFSIEKNDEGADESTAAQTMLVTHVCDEGIGIPADEVTTIFDKFIQSSKTNTGAGGTGLGLSICREIVAAHKGKVWAENNAMEGVTFSFSLPIISGDKTA